MKYAYFDNAATTRVYPEVSEILKKYNEELFYNPSANYLPAVSVHEEVERLRLELLKVIKGFNGTLYFLSSGTEGDNLALFGSKKRKNANIVISESEHPAVYNAAMALKNNGYEVRICPVNSNGTIDMSAFPLLVDENTALISIMHVNNETGGINEIKKLCETAKNINPTVLFHSDGVQAFGKIPLNVSEMGVDFYTISGHKIGAPKGIAALFVAKGVVLSPLLYGGGQENGLRSSTENVGGIMSFGFAARRAIAELPERISCNRGFCAFLREKLSIIEDIRFISDEDCSSHIFTFAFKSIRGEAMQHALSKDGFLVGTGSACSARRAHDRIPKAIGLDKSYSDGIIRVSFGRENSAEEVERLADCILNNYAEMKNYVRK